jgi:hypothetical protein
MVLNPTNNDISNKLKGSARVCIPSIGLMTGKNLPSTTQSLGDSKQPIRKAMIIDAFRSLSLK